MSSFCWLNLYFGSHNAMFKWTHTQTPGRLWAVKSTTMQIWHQRFLAKGCGTPKTDLKFIPGQKRETTTQWNPNQQATYESYLSQMCMCLACGRKQNFKSCTGMGDDRNFKTRIEPRIFWLGSNSNWVLCKPQDHCNTYTLFLSSVSSLLSPTTTKMFHFFFQD